MQGKTETKGTDQTSEESRPLPSKIVYMFRKVPTLAALFGETISFQSLATVLNVYFVRQLKDQISLDTDRASFTGRFYAYVNGASAVVQFLVLPLAREILEPKLVYRFMPLILMPPLIFASFQSSSMMVAALGYFSLKTLDYSLRNVVNEMVYQPLDFQSRYLGKEVIGVFANRFGKSGMSMILSLLAPLGLGTSQLSRVAVGVGSLWTTSSIILSRLIMSNAEAERRVQEQRNKKQG
jgi:ATP/ADP translocase